MVSVKEAEFNSSLLQILSICTKLSKSRYFLFIYLFIYGCIGSSLLRAGFSLVAASGGCSSLWCAGFSLRWLLLMRSTGSRRKGFRSCGMRAQQSWLVACRAHAQQLWLSGLVTPRHVGYSRTRARTRVPCIGRWILNHCATREVQRVDTFCCVLQPYQY